MRMNERKQRWDFLTRAFSWGGKREREKGRKLTPYMLGMGIQSEGEEVFISVRTESWGRRMACWVIWGGFLSMAWTAYLDEEGMF